MEINYRMSESNTKPLEIDVSLSDDGVYIRRDIKEVEVETMNGQKVKKYQYQEAFLTKSEYEAYSRELIAKTINGEDNSQAYADYKRKLDTPIEYPANGFTYKPKWAETVYAGLLQKGAMLPDIFPLPIYDSTETEERMQKMTMQELITLSIFLATAQERFFKEYKEAKVGL